MEEARTLRCAALVAESLQMELCPGVGAEPSGSGYDAALAPEPRSQASLPQLKHPDPKSEPVTREPQRAKRGHLPWLLMVS